MVGKRLLVIEDDIDSLDAVSELLHQAGHEVLTAANGRDGLKILHAGTPLDLVLLDFWLPDMTGHAFLATRTRWPGALTLPVLIVTGDDAYIDEHRDLRQLGVVGVLRKPLESQQVLSAVEQVSLLKLTDAELNQTLGFRPSEPPTASFPAVSRQGRRLSDLLVRASEMLAQTVDVTSHLRDVTRLVVPGLADFCAIEQADHGAQRRLLCSAHADGAQEQQLRGLLELNQGLLRASVEVLETGQPCWHEELSDEVLGALVHSPQDAQTLKALGLDSILIVPMIARRRVFGALTWASFGGQRRYNRDHVETATDLAHRVALALDNDQLFRAAQDAQQAREELLALVSHDLRTPLSAIALTAAKALQAAGSSADADSATTILRNVRRMERIIRDLLDYSQLEAGSLRVELRKERLSELVRAAVESSRPLASRHVLTCELDEAARELDVLCDRERILQVLANLIANAVRVSPPQGRIAVRLSHVAGEARLSVRDSGPAMTPDQIAQLFEGFRLRGSGLDSRQDASIGLYIARGLIEAQRGRLWVESDLAGGSSFSFTLGASVQPGASAEKPGLRPILLVDDDFAFRRELQEILRERGYSVETADNGWQAWSYLQSNSPPALILLDLMMPVMDGWELHAAIKSHPVLAMVPTVIVSCLDRYRIEPSLADAQGYIEKPIRTAQLFDVVQRHVSGPALLRAQSLRPEP